MPSTQCLCYAERCAPLGTCPRPRDMSSRSGGGFLLQYLATLDMFLGAMSGKGCGEGGRKEPKWSQKGRVDSHDPTRHRAPNLCVAFEFDAEGPRERRLVSWRWVWKVGADACKAIRCIARYGRLPGFGKLPKGLCSRGFGLRNDRLI